MENSKEMMMVAASASEGDSQFTNLLFDVSQQLQIAVENMLKMAGEIEQSSSETTEEIEKCKESVGIKRKLLEDDKGRFQKAAMAVLEMLNGH